VAVKQIQFSVFLLVLQLIVVGCGNNGGASNSGDKRSSWSSTQTDQASSNCTSTLQQTTAPPDSIAGICSCWLDQVTSGYTPQESASSTNTDAVYAILKNCALQNNWTGFQSLARLRSALRTIQEEDPFPRALREALERAKQKNPKPPPEHESASPATSARPVQQLNPYEPPVPVASGRKIEASRFRYERAFRMFDPDSLAERELHDTSVRNSYLQTKVADAKSVEDTIDSVMTKKDRLIVLGETHHLGFDDQVYPELLVNLKKKFPKIKYLFLEMPSEWQGDLDLYLQGKGPYPNFFTLKEFSKALEVARKLGLQIRLVDPWSLHDSSMPGMKDRNESMAAEIGKCLKSDPQAQGILITGKSHTTPSYYYQPLQAWTIPTQELLRREDGIHSRVFNLVKAGETGVRIPADAPNSFGFLPGKNAPVYLPRPSEIPAQVYHPLLGKDLYFSSTGTDQVPSREEYIKSIRPMYWSDSDAVLVYRLK